MDKKNKIIKGRKVDLHEEAPSWTDDFLRAAARGYKVEDIIPTLKFLISDIPINEEFWRKANYSHLKFKYNNEKVLLFTKHGLEESICKVIDGKMDISDLILDLSKLIGSAIKDKGAREAFRQEIQEKVKNGIEKKVVRL